MEDSKNNDPIKKHTPLGVSAFVLSVFALVFFILMGLSNSNGGNGGILGPLYFILGIISTVLAIVDLATGKGRKSLSIWSLILVWGFLIFAMLYTMIALANF